MNAHAAERAEAEELTPWYVGFRYNIPLPDSPLRK
jgi:hypothetical protein